MYQRKRLGMSRGQKIRLARDRTDEYIRRFDESLKKPGAQRPPDRWGKSKFPAGAWHTSRPRFQSWL